MTRVSTGARGIPGAGRRKPIVAEIPSPAVLAAALVGWCLVAAPTAKDDVAARARKLHESAIVIDTHIDTTARLLAGDWSFLDRHEPPAPGPRGPATGRSTGSHVDLPRMREGGLDAAFFSIFISGTITGPTVVKRAMEQIDAVRQLAARHPEQIALATSAEEVRAAHEAGKVAALMGMEGGHMIDDSLPVLRNYAQLGIRYLTLTHSVHTSWADSSSQPPRHGGLTAFGKNVIRELNRLGVMVDVSHVADETFWDALEVSRAPLLASHSSCRAISGHPRNLTDEMIRALAAKGGIIQINYLDAYLDNELYLAQSKRQQELAPLRAELENKYPGEENAEKRRQELRAASATLPPLPRPSWEKIVEHIDHAVKLAGDEHVGLGSDFDGATMPVGMEDVTRLPKITEALLRKGYTERQVRNILGENLLRLMDRVAQVAKETPGPTARM
jgi:membrane dipeptidase